MDQAILNERIGILVEFVTNPIYANQDDAGDHDDDVVSTYNLAVIDSLQCIRAAALQTREEIRGSRKTKDD